MHTISPTNSSQIYTNGYPQRWKRKPKKPHKYFIPIKWGWSKKKFPIKYHFITFSQFDSVYPQLIGAVSGYSSANKHGLSFQKHQSWYSFFNRQVNFQDENVTQGNFNLFLRFGSINTVYQYSRNLILSFCCESLIVLDYWFFEDSCKGALTKFKEC